MFLDKDRDAVFVVAGGYKIGGGTGGVAAVCHGHAHAGVSTMQVSLSSSPNTQMFWSSMSLSSATRTRPRVLDTRGP